NRFDQSSALFTNRWGLTVSNRFVYFLFDGVRLVDAFTSARMSTYYNLSAELTKPQNDPLRLWRTGLATQRGIPVSEGASHQIRISTGEDSNNGQWNDYAGIFSSSQLERDGFRKWIDNDPAAASDPSSQILVRETPFNAGQKFAFVKTWQVNDPLV